MKKVMQYSNFIVKWLEILILCVWEEKKLDLSHNKKFDKIGNCEEDTLPRRSEEKKVVVKEHEVKKA